MSLKQNIEEQHIAETTLQVFHRQLKVHENVYFEAIGYTDPWDERIYQEFVQKYLDEINDSGIVGMVRVEKHPPYIVFDAAVRYPKN